jgi:two-component system, NarL family, nitrate/nitrite response regulator NarL
MPIAETVRILIVEDNATTLRHLGRVVHECFEDELQVTLTEDVEVACQHLQSAAFELVLIDLALPDQQGLVLLEQASQGAQAHNLRIATTLTEDDALLFPALQRGACAYLLKENRFEVLVEELQKIARGQRPLSPAIARRLLAHFKNLAHSASHECDPDTTLSTLELEVLTHFSKGYTLKETAQRMGMKVFAVCDLIQQGYQKFQKTGLVFSDSV